MLKIKPDALKYCREAKGLSQARLAELTKMDKGTISRIERGTEKVRGRTIELLAEYLGVTPEVLTGQSPLPAPTPEQAPDSKSQLNIRMRDSARNALSLIAARYKIAPTAILELAPFLFECAAIKSLQRRREGVERMERLSAEAQNVQVVACAHLHPVASASWRSEEILRAEKWSIEHNDIWGLTLEGEDEFSGDEILCPDYYEAIDGPFVAYLRSLGNETGGRAEFESWSDFPLYTVCWPEMLAQAEGDAVIAEHIQDGAIALHEMPKEVRTGPKEARISWFNEKREEHSRKIKELYGDLSDLLAEQPTKEIGK